MHNIAVATPKKIMVQRVNFQTRQCLVKIAIMTVLASPKDDDQFTPTLSFKVHKIEASKELGTFRILKSNSPNLIIQILAKCRSSNL